MQQSPHIMEKKNLNFPLSISDLGESGTFSGYASVFGKKDNHNDIIVKGAFKKTLASKNIQQDIKLLWQHDTTEPIGIFTKISEDAYGLYVEGKLLLDVQRAREAYALLKAHALSGLSIGFTVKDYSYDANSVRYLKDIDLFEISLVTFPANDDAVITSVKNNDDYHMLDISFDRAFAALKNLSHS